MALSLALPLVAGAALRVIGLGRASAVHDDGVYIQTIFLLQQGHALYAEIFASQWPLFFYSLFPFYWLGGQALAAARLGVACLSLSGILGAWWIGRQTAGPLGGFLSGSVFAISPLLVFQSRELEAEMPSLGFALLAFGATLQWASAGRTPWLSLAAACLAISLLIKPITVGVVAGLLVLLSVPRQPRRLLKETLLVVAVGLGIAAVVLLPHSLPALWQQLWEYRVAAKAAFPRDQGWERLLAAFQAESLGLFLLSAAGIAGLLLIGSTRRVGVAMAAWVLASFLLLMDHAPLERRHFVALLGPIAVLAGFSLAWTLVTMTRVVPIAIQHVTRGLVPRSLSSRWTGNARATNLGSRVEWGRPLEMVCLALGLVGLVWYGSGLPALAQANLKSLDGEPRPLNGVPREAAAAAVIAVLAEPNEPIVTDFQYVPFLAGRPVPPDLADTSFVRVRAGWLSSDELLVRPALKGADLVLLWNRRLVQVPGFPEALVRDYRPLARFDSNRVLYVPAYARPAELAARLQAAFTAHDVVYGERVRLMASYLSGTLARAGEEMQLVLAWEMLGGWDGPLPLVSYLRGDDEADQKFTLGAPADELGGWPPQGLFLERYPLRLPKHLEAGQYSLELTVREPDSGGVLSAGPVWRERYPLGHSVTVRR